MDVVGCGKIWHEVRTEGVQSCTTITITTSGCFPYPPKKPLLAVNVSPHCWLPQPQATSNLLAFFGFANSCNGIIHEGIIRVWLLSLCIVFSRTIHVEPLSVLHSFLWLNSIPLYEYAPFCVSTIS